MNEFRSTAATRSVASEGGAAHAHNIFLQTGLDLGVFGLSAYCCVLGFVLAKAHEAAQGTMGSARAASVGAGAALVGVTLFGLGDAVALGAKVGLFQWTAGGLILGAWRTQLAFKRPESTTEIGEGLAHRSLPRPIAATRSGPLNQRRAGGIGARARSWVQTFVQWSRTSSTRRPGE